MQIGIIGAGPVGAYAASILARQGHKVSLYEEHNEVGVPVQCTGLLTGSLQEVLKPNSEYIVNRTSEIEIIAPNGSKAYVSQREYIVHRTKFDRWLVNEAESSGARLETGHKFIGCKGNRLFFAKNAHKHADLLVGADGANSTVAQLINSRKREYVVGIQARVKGNFDPSLYTVYFGNEISPGFFAWVVPENKNFARVGLKGKAHHFNDFIKKHNYEKIEMQAGPIPVYDRKFCTEKEGVMLIGDAAGQVKATTAGGIIPGLKAAECLGESVSREVSYEKRWKQRIGRDLLLHLFLRRTLDKFTDNDWNLLIEILQDKKLRKALETYDREHPSKLVFASLKELRLWRFVPKSVKALPALF